MAEHGGQIGSSGGSSPMSDNESGGQFTAGQDTSVREQDRFLPIANVSRIMKRALPANAKISKDAKETVQECVSEFISFITGEASDKCQREKRKTINGDDLLWAMTTLGFEEYVELLKLYLHKYRELEGEKASMAKQADHSLPKEIGPSNGSVLPGDTLNTNGNMDMNVNMSMNTNINMSMGMNMNGAAVARVHHMYGQPPSATTQGPIMVSSQHHQMVMPYQMSMPLPGAGSASRAGQSAAYGR